MENCFLCLEENIDDLDAIKVNSSQWLELNIQNLIEKHLWNMETLKTSSWICFNCWQKLHDFHSFYIRIEEAHKHIEDTHINEYKDLFLKININESLKSEIISDQLTKEDTELYVKEEVVEDFLDENIPLIELSNRIRHSKNLINNVKQINQDPLKNSQLSKVLSKRKKKQSSKQSEINLESSETELKLEEDADSLQIQVEAEKLSCNLDHSTDLSKNAYPFKRSKKLSLNSDSGNLDLSKQTKKKTSYQRERRKEVTKRNKKITVKERDEFLAKNFKMSCVLCQIPMVDFGTLTAHFDGKHKDERAYVICCNRKFYAPYILMTHLYRHVDPNKFKCNQCGKVLACEKYLNYHLLTHVPEEELKFPCSVCDKRFGTKSGVDYHLKQVHLKLFTEICEVCGKSIKRKEFDRHMLEHEGKSLTVYCKICGLGLSHKDGLRRHMKYQHTVGVDLKKNCPICNKVSANINSLSKHIAYVHKAENVQKCKICDKTCKTPREVKEHMATHNDVALYTCSWCPKTYKASSSYFQHRRKHHPIEVEEERKKKYLE